MDGIICIICGRDFNPPDPDTVICPECGGPTAAPEEPDRVFNTRRALEPAPGGIGTRRQDDHPAPPAQVFTGDARILHPGQTILGLYEIRNVLGKGGMGTVYRAHHGKWGIDLAVKVPNILDDPALQGQFVHEAEAWIDLGLHPHIVSCFYVRRMEGQLLIFAECVDAGALKDHIGPGDLNSLEKILDMSIQFAWGLAYAHARGLVHNDVKPGNVLLSKDGTLKVTDFGLAGSVGSYTLPYASPEQYLGQRTSLKTDIWSWALSVLHMFNGELSWQDGTIAGSILENYRSDGPVVAGMPAMPEDVHRLLQECFEDNPERRPRGMDVVGEQLLSIYERSTGRPYPRKHPKEADLRADSLNNKALSLLDLGREAEAVRLWELALEEDPAHTQANLNLADWRWRAVHITDDEMLAHLNQVEGQRTDDAARWYGLGCLHGERGEVEKARDSFQQARRIDPALAVPETMNAVTPLPALAGHAEPIYAFACTSDGLLATGSADQTIRTWDLARDRPPAVFKDAGFVTSIAFSPDGAWMASGSNDRTVRIWDVGRRKCVRRITGHEDVVSTVAFSADGEHVISGSLDGTARVWERGKGKCVLEYREHERWVLSLLVVPGEDLVLSASRDQTVRLWNPFTGRTIRVFERPPSPRKAEYGRVSLAGGRVLWAGYDRMSLWEYDSARLLRNFRSCEDTTAITPFVDGELSPDGRLALTAGSEGELRVWDPETGRCIHTMPAQGAIWRASFTGPDSIAAGQGIEVKRWLVRIDPGLELFQPMLSQPETGVEALEKQSRLETCLDEAGKRLAGGRVKDAVAGLRAFQEEPGFAHNDEILSMLARCGRTGRKSGLREWWRRAIFKLGEYEGLGGVTAVRFSPDGGTLAAGQYEGTVGVYDTASGTTRRVLNRLIGPVLALVFLAEDDLLALSKNGDLVRWDLSAGQGQAIRTGLDPNDGAHLSAVLAEDGGYMAVLGLKGYSMYDVRLGDTARLGVREFSPRVLRAKFDLGIPNVMEGPHAGYDYRAAVSPDSRFYSTSIMNTNFGPGAHPVYVWAVRQGSIALAQTLLGHTAPVLTMAFSPAGETLISADISGLIRLWGLPGGNCIREIRQPGSQFTSLTFSADGSRILAGDSEGRLFLWRTDGRERVANHTHSGAVNAVAFSCDDRFAASGGYDNTIQLWEFDWDYAF